MRKPTYNLPMSQIVETLLIAYKRDHQSLNELEKSLERLPKGALVVSHLKSGNYVYRRLRKNGKSTSVYVGKEGSKEHQEAIKERALYLLTQKEIRKLRESLKERGKALVALGVKP